MTIGNFVASGVRLAGSVRRRGVLAGASAAMLLALVPHSFAADVSGDLVLLDWASGSEQDMIKALEAGFMKAYPNVNFKEINLTTSGDQRGAIRAALQSGEKADIFINTWPAFRKELADAGMLRDLAVAVGQRQDRRQSLRIRGRPRLDRRQALRHHLHVRRSQCDVLQDRYR